MTADQKTVMERMRAGNSGAVWLDGYGWAFPEDIRWSPDLATLAAAALKLPHSTIPTDESSTLELAKHDHWRRELSTGQQVLKPSENREILSLNIPGLAAAASESHDAQERIDGERLSLFIQSPPVKSLDSDSIQSGPLFRGTEASPQNELFCPNSDK